MCKRDCHLPLDTAHPLLSGSALYPIIFLYQTKSVINQFSARAHTMPRSTENENDAASRNRVVC